MMTRNQAMDIFHHPRKIESVSSGLAGIFDHLVIEVVVGLGLNGAMLAEGVALCLTKMFAISHCHVLVACAEIDFDRGTVQLRSGDEQLLVEQNVLIVTDIIDSEMRSSVKMLAKTIQDVGGEVVGVGAVWNDQVVALAELGLGEGQTISLSDCPADPWPSDQGPTYLETLRLERLGKSVQEAMVNLFGELSRV